MDIRTIGVFRFAVEDAINMLARLGGKSYDLPAIEEVEALITRLERISPFEVVGSILADNYYKSHRQHYLAAFGGVLDSEAFIGSVKADGKIVDYWGGLADKLKAAAPEIDKNKYLSLVERLGNLVQDNIAGMKKDIAGIFSDEETAQQPQQIPTAPEIDEDKFLSAVSRLSNLVQYNIAGMRADLDGILAAGKQTAPEPTETPPEPQQIPTAQQPTRGRGRPKETFTDKMIDDADGKKLAKMHTIMRGKKGKDFSLLILACIKKGWITRPTYTQAADEFGEIGSKTGFNRYLDERMFGEKEIMGAINSLD